MEVSTQAFSALDALVGRINSNKVAKQHETLPQEIIDSLFTQDELQDYADNALSALEQGIALDRMISDKIGEILFYMDRTRLWDYVGDGSVSSMATWFEWWSAQYEARGEDVPMSYQRLTQLRRIYHTHRFQMKKATKTPNLPEFATSTTSTTSAR